MGCNLKYRSALICILTKIIYYFFFYSEGRIRGVRLHNELETETERYWPDRGENLE